MIEMNFIDGDFVTRMLLSEIKGGLDLVIVDLESHWLTL